MLVLAGLTDPRVTCRAGQWVARLPTRTGRSVLVLRTNMEAGRRSARPLRDSLLR